MTDELSAVVLLHVLAFSDRISSDPGSRLQIFKLLKSTINIDEMFSATPNQAQNIHKYQI